MSEISQKEMQDRIEDLEALIQERAQEAGEEVRSVWDRIPKIARARTLAAFGVLAAVAVVLALVVPDAGALATWLGGHAAWSVQIAFVAAAAVLVIAAFLLLQATVLDPLLIGPEVRQAWLDWYRRYLDGERSCDNDGQFMMAGAIVAGATFIMMGLIALGVFLAASSL